MLASCVEHTVRHVTDIIPELQMMTHRDLLITLTS